MKIVKLSNKLDPGSVISINNHDYLVRGRLFCFHLIKRLCTVYSRGYADVPIYIIPSFLSSLKRK